MPVTSARMPVEIRNNYIIRSHMHSDDSIINENAQNGKSLNISQTRNSPACLFQ